MNTLEEYISEHGYSINDFSESEIELLKKELEAINSGRSILDGVFASKETPDYSKDWFKANAVMKYELKYFE